MNKLARPDCPHCVGGRVRVARTLFTAESAPEVEPPPGQAKTIGFMWVPCGACGGEGKR